MNGGIVRMVGNKRPMKSCTLRAEDSKMSREKQLNAEGRNT